MPFPCDPSLRLIFTAPCRSGHHAAIGMKVNTFKVAPKGPHLVPTAGERAQLLTPYYYIAWFNKPTIGAHACDRRCPGWPTYFTHLLMAAAVVLGRGGKIFKFNSMH